jgi:hypothetical protein
VDFCYVYHVIGTLGLEHVRLSLESLSRQDIRWKTFVLYNGGKLADEEILPLVPDMFDSVEVFPYDPQTPKSAVADWDEQMRGIDGHDFYFTHKADFFLADGVCKTFEEARPELALFSKFDMKEWATPNILRHYASLTWAECLKLPSTGSYGDHGPGKAAIRFAQGLDGVDGTMHAYADSTRGKFSPNEAERQTKWDVAESIQRLANEVGFHTDLRFFAMHMWHQVPEKNDHQKLRTSERF